MEHFWPSLPILIPASQGIPLWFDIVGWVFQIVVMVTIITMITRWAVRMEREMGKPSTQSPARTGTGEHLES